MTRQLEQPLEEKRAKADRYLIKALRRDIELGLANSGRHLLGVSVKVDAYETLITVRATYQGVREVAFVGSAGLAEAFIKLGREAMGDKLRWRNDKFIRPQNGQE